MPRASSLEPEHADVAEGDEEADPGYGGRQHERQLDEGHGQRMARETMGREQIRGRGSEEEDKNLRERRWS